MRFLNQILSKSAFLISLFLFLPSPFYAQSKTSGTASFTVTTVSYGGRYSSKNVGAIWVENGQNQFIKTLELWANRRKKHLVKWNAASGGSVVDAVTSATSRTHKTHSVTWDCTDINGALVSDGTYKIYVEFTEDNSSKSGSPAGKWTVVEFTKGPSNQTVTPPDEQYFKNIELIYNVGGTIPQTASINGSVQDANTRSPIQNATLQLKIGSQVAYETNTNASGAFSIQEIKAGSYSLGAFKAGYQTWAESISLDAGQQVTGKNIYLTPAVSSATLSGYVQEADSNKPISNAIVQLNRGTQTLYQTATDTSGAYQLSNITPDAYLMVSFKKGYATWSENLTLNSGQSLTNKIIRLSKINTADTFPPSPPKNVRVRKAGN